MNFAATLPGQLAPGMVHQDLPHSAGCDGEEVRAILYGRMCSPYESHVRLVHDCGRLKCVSGPFALHHARGYTAELAVDERQYLRRSLFVIAYS